MKLRKKCQKGVRKDIAKNKKGISGRPFWEERFLGMLDLCGFPAPGNCFWEVEFGRFARQNRKARGERKPDTFDFLGFTFYCGMDGKKQFFRCRVKTSKKKFRSKIKAMKEWIKIHRTMPLEQIFKTVNAKLRGHYQYYGVTDNTKEVKNFLTQTKWLLFKWLNRRSQKRSYTLDTFFNGLLRTFPLLEPSIKVSLFYR